jgi:disulfide bond formation protein DsbB
VSTDQVSVFFALLALLAELGAVLLALSLIARRISPAAQWPRAVLASVSPLTLVLAASVATAATLGSLYYSEIANFPPCHLCWYQRICMYPLALILGIAAARRDRSVRWYALPLVVTGAAISTWHILVEHFPSLASGACDPTNPCSIVWVEKFGYLTIPAMALSGFVVLGLLLVLPQETP